MRLHDYQKLARDFLQQHKEAGLFLDMGYGKTAITLAAIEPRHLPVLVVAPKRVAEHVWPEERDLWRPDLELALAAGDPAQRIAAINRKADLTIIGRDNLKNAPVGRYRTVVFDELSGYKDRGTNRWRMGRKLAQHAENVWGLTGTPTPNGLLDLWAQIFLLDGGARLDTSVVRYRNRYFVPDKWGPNGVVYSYRLKPEAEQHIYEKIEDICLSMEGEVELPPVTHNRVEVEISKTLRGVYKEFARELTVDLDMLGGNIYSASNAAILTSKLSQLTAGFLFEDEGTGAYKWLHDSKMKALEEVAEGTGDNLLVYYRFIPERDRILELFPYARFIDEHNAIRDWSTGKVRMLVAHPAAAGHGLNLQYGGHTIVWTTVPWSLEEWLQANGRVARQGQKHPVMIHRIEVPGTIDPRIYEDKVNKKFDQDALLDHVRSPM